MQRTLLLSTLLLFCCTVWAQPLTFHSSRGLSITVKNDKIFVNGNSLYSLNKDEAEVKYESKLNQLREDSGSVFLFLEIFAGPGFDQFYVFKITARKVDLVVKAMSSLIKDWDGDGYLEFGGCDINEVPENPDLMYFNSYDYYEIRNGKIAYDKEFSDDMTFYANGVTKADRKDGTVLRPWKRKVVDVPLVHPRILSERIDGPANIRDAINGKLLFELHDNMPVYTSDTLKKWCSVGIRLHLSEKDYLANLIPKETRIFSEYDMEIGKTLTDLHLDPFDTYEDHGEFYGLVRGYTAMQNIKPQTQPENALVRVLGGKTAVTLAELRDYISGYQFESSTIGKFVTYQLDAEIVTGPTGEFRLILVFDNDRLVGVVHKRMMDWKAKDIALHRGLIFSVIGEGDQVLLDEFTKQANSFIDHAD